MSYDTVVRPRTWWYAGGNVRIDEESGDLAEQVAENIRELLAETERDRLVHDNGATELRVEITVKLVPVDTCQHCKGTGTIGVIVRVGGAGEEDVQCPACKGEGRR